MEISIIPKFLINRFVENSIRQINWNILISSCLVLIFMALLTINTVNSIPHFCLFYKLTGLPCPGCGMIRSIQCLVDFELSESLSYNPCGILIIVSIIIQIPMRIIALKNEYLFFRIDKLSQILTRLVIALLLIFWIIHIINLKL